MAENKMIVVVCGSHAQVEQLVAHLSRFGFDAKDLSIFGKLQVSEEEVVGCY
ncbi:MAG: hypothetical protein ABSG53_29215 [Thermoguttaceae bacterium]|jgi:hypothetical protein